MAEFEGPPTADRPAYASAAGLAMWGPVAVASDPTGLLSKVDDDGFAGPLVYFFGAYWCRDCAGNKKELKEALGGLTCVVHVPSDGENAIVAAFVDKLGGTNTWTVLKVDQPYCEALKRHLKTCAATEASNIGVNNRKSGIPCAVAVNPKTGLEISRCDTIGKFGEFAQSLAG